ncbi:MAG TPA: hypothetical protein VI072_25880 [Polyangiaceae bacterium]
MLGSVWLFFAAKLFLSYLLIHDSIGVVWAVADDAYITADFARTLAQGEGLRWYPGAPKVEGFSSPLWVLVMAPLHWLPGFTEDRLGLFVFGVNSLILLGCAWAFALGVDRTRLAAGTHLPRMGVVPWIALWVVAGVVTISFSSWTSRGFEVALVALLALSAYAEAVRPGGYRAWCVGLLIGLAVVARMDAALYCIPAGGACALHAWRTRDWRRLLVAAVTSVGLVGTLLLSRYFYYGDWLPNTYYLKATNWPVSERLGFGLDQNAWPILVAAVFVVPFAVVLWIRGKRGALLPILCLSAHLAVLAYSTCLGGDFSFESFAYDRFTAVGALFLLLGLFSGLLSVPLRGALRIVATCWAIGSLVLPVVFRPNAAFLAVVRPAELFTVRGFNWKALVNLKEPLHQIDNWAQLFVYFGKTAEQVSLPGARIALCPAGAPVYFSHRGGVDLLGKVDPLVARLRATKVPPVERRCWQAHVGHNKEDIALSFRVHKPDLSLPEPPAEAAANYIHFKYGKLDWWARRDSPYVRWPVVELARRSAGM